jgi:hypothetical protein
MRFHVSANRYQLDAGQQRPASASIEQIDKQPRGIGMPRLRRDHQSVDFVQFWDQEHSSLLETGIYLCSPE